MFYLFDICLGFCALLVCAVYAYIKHAHSGSRLFHQFLGIVWVVVTYIVSIWVEAVWNILYLSSTLRCYLCLGVGMFGGTTVLYIVTRLLDNGFILAGNFVSFVFLTYVFLCFGCRRRYSKKTRLRYRSIGSYNWSRRRVLWLQKKNL